MMIQKNGLRPDYEYIDRKRGGEYIGCDIVGIDNEGLMLVHSITTIEVPISRFVKTLFYPRNSQILDSVRMIEIINIEKFQYIK